LVAIRCLKTYIHSCEPAIRRGWIYSPRHCEASQREAVAISPAVIASSQRAILHPLSLRAASGGRGNLKSFVIARLPEGKPRNLFSKVNLNQFF